MEPLYTPLEAARLLKLSEHTVWKLLREKRLKGYKIGNHWRIPESAIVAWLESLSNQREDREP
jgi:excisionase family DNA binding protein